MLEATKRGMAWDLLLAKKIRRSARFCRVGVYRRACREISANGKFEGGYLKVHGASACQLHLLFCLSSRRYDQYEASRLSFCQSVLLKIIHNLYIQEAQIHYFYYPEF